MRFPFPYPVNPWSVTQPWGVYDPRYKQFGFTAHNGVDCRLGADRTIYAPHAGTVVRAYTKENGLWQPAGGGVFLTTLTDEQYDFDDGQKCYVLEDFLHCERLLVKDGDHVEVGQAIAIADNTGFSTGPHTHIQLRREVMQPYTGQPGLSPFRIRGNDYALFDVDKNNANNSFDPAPYYSLTYVIPLVPSEEEKKKGLLLQIISLYQQIISLYKGRKTTPP